MTCVVIGSLVEKCTTFDRFGFPEVTLVPAESLLAGDYVRNASTGESVELTRVLVERNPKRFGLLHRMGGLRAHGSQFVRSCDAWGTLEDIGVPVHDTYPGFVALVFWHSTPGIDSFSYL